MKLDTTLSVNDFSEVAAYAREAENIGFSGLWSIEAAHEPFMPLAVAASVTQGLELGTAIALAFPRSPMVLAYTAWDLQASSRGRFKLGLGTQVKGHNERRFSVKWEAPVKRVREVILSLRAIWNCWQNGTPLDFRGEFYDFTLMTPFFVPGKLDHPKIPIYLAGLNEQIVSLAGEVADGFHVHPLHSRKYLETFLLPNLERGAAAAGRSRRDVEISAIAFVIMGDSRKELEEARERTRSQISFYASTRTYLPPLEAHGWADVCQRLNAKAAKGDWKGMAAEITDEMLDVYAVTGTPDEVPGKLQAKYGGLVDRLTFYFGDRPGENLERWRQIARGFARS